MQRLEWFGGFVRGTGADGPIPVPLPARPLQPVHPEHPEPMLWNVGDFPVAVVSRGDRCAAVFGTCSISDRELERLVAGLTNADLVSWNGTYTVVHSMPSAVTILTDPAGAQPIYLAHVAGGVAWGSSSRALAALVGNRISEDYLAQAVTGRAPNRSAFEGVRLLPPGARVEVRSDGTVRTEIAWEPGRWSVASGIERLRSSLAGGVEVRIENVGRVTADCSGGLDSTTVCLLCGPDRVTALNVRPPDRDSGGDLDYVHAVDQAYPMLKRCQVVIDEAQLPYSKLDRLPVTDEPPRSVTVSARHAYLCQVLRELGSDIHFTGDGADALLIPPLSYVAYLTRTNPWQAWRHRRAWAYLFRTSPWRPGGVSPESPARSESIIERVRAAARPAASDLQMATAQGVRVTNPYFDNRVVDAVLGVPVEHYASPEHYKPLLVEAFADVLPTAIATRRTKATLLPDHHRGIRSNLPALLDLVDGELSSMHLIDPVAVRAALRDAAAGIGVDLSRIEAAIGTEAWLRAVRSAPAVQWERT